MFVISPVLSSKSSLEIVNSPRDFSSPGRLADLDLLDDDESDNFAGGVGGVGGFVEEGRGEGLKKDEGILWMFSILVGLPGLDLSWDFLGLKQSPPYTEEDFVS